MYRVFKKKELEVRNSPLDRFATMAGKLIFCAKGACDSAVPIGTAVGLMAGMDQLLEAKGREAIFFPFLAEVLLPNSENQKISDQTKKLFRRNTSLNER